MINLTTLLVLPVVMTLGLYRMALGHWRLLALVERSETHPTTAPSPVGPSA